MKPPKRITDPTFVYTPSHLTCVRATFERERERLRKEAERQPTPIRKKIA